VRSFGSLRDNGRLICDWLAGCSETRIVLVSLSKGGADVKIALTQPGASEAFRNVVAWVNLSGIVNGTPLAAWLLARPLRSLLIKLLFWYRGHSFAVVRELDRDMGKTLRVPEHVKVIHVVGFPLRRHLSNGLMRRGHRRLAPLGPNDGGMLLADAVTLPGIVFPVWGADHYLRPAGRCPRGLFARILRYICEEIEPLESSVAEKEIR
jgi:hypothetical protein